MSANNGPKPDACLPDQPVNEAGASPFSPRVRGWLLGLLLLAAAAIRIRGALNDLWLDEIWSLNLVRGISSPLQVFTKIHHDNNNYLNSLWLFLWGFHGNWPGYRVPSIVAGVGSVMLAGMTGRRRNAPAAWFAMLLTAFSYVQILYSSEARGYSEVVFFSFLSFHALEKYLEKQEWPSAVLVSISSILGFASHLIFLNFFAAAVLWSGWRLIKSGLGFAHVLKGLLACHAAPAALLTILYFVDIRHQTMGGGAGYGPGVYLDSLAWTLGVPPGRYGALFASLPTLSLFIAGIWILRREKSDSWILFAGVILVVPILLAWIRHSDVLYVRHFIVGMAFLLILFSFVLAALYQRGFQGRVVCVLLMAGYFVLNGWHTAALFKHGRGHYGEAARFLAEHTKAPVVTIGGDQDFRINTVLRFYAADAMGNKTAKYYPVKSWPKGGPEWFVSQKESFEDPAPPGEQYTDSAGNTYEWVKTFQSAPLSGLHWFVCHNTAK
jgi:hypothetical protein